MKSEPNTYSIEDLRRDGQTSWEGVRNYQARNFMRDDMKVGDKVLFYHSSAKPAGVAGLARVVREAYPDAYAWQEGHPYFDPKTDPANPRWFMVDVEFVEAFAEVVALAELKAEPALAEMLVIRKGQRLSVMPVSAQEFEAVAAMGRAKEGR